MSCRLALNVGVRRDEITAPRAFDLVRPVSAQLGRGRMCRERLGRLKDLLLSDVPVARQALRKLLPEPLEIAPVTVDGRLTNEFEGVTTLGPQLDPALLPTAYKGWRPETEPIHSRHRSRYCSGKPKR